jgi:hypothetical protein
MNELHAGGHKLISKLEWRNPNGLFKVLCLLVLLLSAAENSELPAYGGLQLHNVRVKLQVHRTVLELSDETDRRT